MTVGRPLQMPFRTLTGSELAIPTPPPYYCRPDEPESAPPPPVPTAAAAQGEASTARRTWIPLESWLGCMAASREWSPSDTTAFIKWECVSVLLTGKYTALQDEQYSQGLIWDSWSSDHLLVRGELDMSQSYAELDVATTIQVAFAGTWSPLPPVQDKHDVVKREHEISNLVDNLIWRYFPHYSVLRAHPDPQFEASFRVDEMGQDGSDS